MGQGEDPDAGRWDRQYAGHHPGGAHRDHRSAALPAGPAPAGHQAEEHPVPAGHQSVAALQGARCQGARCQGAGYWDAARSCQGRPPQPPGWRARRSRPVRPRLIQAGLLRPELLRPSCSALSCSALAGPGRAGERRAGRWPGTTRRRGGSRGRGGLRSTADDTIGVGARRGTNTRHLGNRARWPGTRARPGTGSTGRAGTASRSRGGHGRTRGGTASGRGHGTGTRAMFAAAALIPIPAALLATGLVPADSGRRGTSIAGTRAVARTRTPLLRSARELLLEPPDYRRLDRRGRRTHELTHFLKLGHDGLALYTELLSEFVNPDLRHYAPLPPRRPACQSVGFKYRIIGRSGAECAPSRPQSRSFIALCSSSAHQLLDLLSVQVSVASSSLPVKTSPVRCPSPPVMLCPGDRFRKILS